MHSEIIVVHIITNLGSGGAERVLTNIASQNISNVRQIVVSLTDDGFYGAQLRANDIQIISLGMRRGRPSISAYARLVGILRSLRPSLVMTWLYHADLMGTLAARHAGLRNIIWNLRCSDIDFKNYSPLTRGIVHVLSRMSDIPIAIAANSNAGRQSHESLGYKNNQWFYLPNGFDGNIWKPDQTDRNNVRKQLDLDGKFVFGIIGRSDPQKDYQNLFDASTKLISASDHDVRFVLIGRGTRELLIPTSVQRYFLAMGERNDIPKLLRAFDSLVLCSASGEGFPNVVGEAMSASVPCIATDVGDCSHLIGDTGLVIPPRDSQALCAAMENLLGKSETSLKQMGVRARARIAGAFSLTACTERYEDVFKWGAQPQQKKCD